VGTDLIVLTEWALSWSC